MIASERFVSPREIRRTAPIEQVLWDLSDTLSLTDSHFASSQRECIMQMGEAVQRVDLTDPREWSHETALLFFSTMDAYISSDNSADFPIGPLITELNLRKPKNRPDVGTVSESDTIFQIPGVETFDLESEEELLLGKYYSTYRTLKTKDEFFDKWGLRSPLRKTRKKFGITQDKESKYRLVVTRLSTNDFQNLFYSGAFVLDDGNIRTMALPKDSTENTRIHEYIHTQWNGLSQGKNRALYRGIEEAFVESNTPYPAAYQPQRDVFDEFSYYISDFSSMVKNAAESSPAREELLRSVLSVFGLPGVQAVSRYTPIPNTNSEGFYTQRQRELFLSISDTKKSLLVLQ